MGQKPKSSPLILKFIWCIDAPSKCHMIMKLCWNQSRKTKTLFHNQWNQLHMQLGCAFFDGILFWCISNVLQFENATKKTWEIAHILRFKHFCTRKIKIETWLMDFPFKFCFCFQFHFFTSHFQFRMQKRV